MPFSSARAPSIDIGIVCHWALKCRISKCALARFYFVRLSCFELFTFIKLRWEVLIAISGRPNKKKSRKWEIKNFFIRENPFEILNDKAHALFFGEFNLIGRKGNFGI